MNVVASTMKLASLFRGWGRRAESPAAAEPTPMPAPIAPVEVPAPTPQPIPVAPQPQPTQLASEVEMPLQTILEKLPQDLRAKMAMRPEELGDASIAIPIEQILPQLALGSVKIMFGQLRSAAPELFRVAEEYDSLPIILPLNVLLQRMNPNLLPRNPQQKQIQLPQEIKGPFGKSAEGVTFATSLMKAPPAATPPPRMVAKPESDTKMRLRSVGPAQPAFTRATTAAPIAPSSIPFAPSAPVSPIAPAPPREETQRPIPFSPPQPAPAAPVAMPKPITPVAPAPIPMATAPSAAPVAANASAISVLLSELSAKWPDVLQMEIHQQNLSGAQVQLPMTALEPALKRGRAVFSWQHLRTWMQPRPAGASPNDGVELDLPLAIIV